MSVPSLGTTLHLTPSTNRCGTNGCSRPLSAEELEGNADLPARPTERSPKQQLRTPLIVLAAARKRRFRVMGMLREAEAQTRTANLCSKAAELHQIRFWTIRTAIDSSEHNPRRSKEASQPQNDVTLKNDQSRRYRRSLLTSLSSPSQHTSGNIHLSFASLWRKEPSSDNSHLLSPVGVPALVGPSSIDGSLFERPLKLSLGPVFLQPLAASPP